MIILSTSWYCWEYKMSYYKANRQSLAHDKWYLHSVMVCVIINLITFAQWCNIRCTLSILSCNVFSAILHSLIPAMNTAFLSRLRLRPNHFLEPTLIIPVQGLANCFCKESGSKYFRFWRPSVRWPSLLQLLYSVMVVGKEHRQYVQEWSLVCFNKPLFVKVSTHLALGPSFWTYAQVHGGMFFLTIQKAQRPVVQRTHARDASPVVSGGL